MVIDIIYIIVSSWHVTSSPSAHFAKAKKDGKEGWVTVKGAADHRAATDFATAMDWFKGTSTGNHRFSHEIWGLPVKKSLNQSID